MSAPAQQRDAEDPNFCIEGKTAYDEGIFRIIMMWGHFMDDSQGIRPEEAVAWIIVEGVSGHSEGLPLEPVRIKDVEAHDESYYLGKYRVVSLVSYCFHDGRSLANWFNSENVQKGLQEEHNKAVATSGTGESSHQPQTPSVVSTMATGASIPPSIQTARDHESDEDDRRSDHSNSTVPSDVE